MKDKIYYFTEKSNDILDLQDELTIEEIGMYFILKAAYFKNFGELKENNLVQRCRFFGDKEKLMKLARKLFEFKESDLVSNSWLSQIKGIKEKSNKRKDAANARWQKEQEESKTEAKPKQEESKTEGNVNDNISVDFENFWQSYKPIHTSKGVKKEAQEAFIKALKKDTIENITKGLKDYMSDCHSKGTYTKQVDGWLKKMMWKAEYSQQPTQNNQTLCQAINKLIGSDLITKIEAVGSKAAFYTTKDGWQSITALDGNTKSEIKKTLNAALGVSEIEPKY